MRDKNQYIFILFIIFFSFILSSCAVKAILITDIHFDYLFVSGGEIAARASDRGERTYIAGIPLHVIAVPIDTGNTVEYIDERLQTLRSTTATDTPLIFSPLLIEESSVFAQKYPERPVLLLAPYQFADPIDNLHSIQYDRTDALQSALRYIYPYVLQKIDGERGRREVPESADLTDEREDIVDIDAEMAIDGWVPKDAALYLKGLLITPPPDPWIPAGYEESVEIHIFSLGDLEDSQDELKLIEETLRFYDIQFTTFLLNSSSSESEVQRKILNSLTGRPIVAIILLGTLNGRAIESILNFFESDNTLDTLFVLENYEGIDLPFSSVSLEYDIPKSIREVLDIVRTTPLEAPLTIEAKFVR